MEQIDMEKIINEEVDKFKFHRKDVKFEIYYDKKSKYYGSIENWETIFDNLLSNFMRYADKNIKITARQNKIILYNTILNGIKKDSTNYYKNINVKHLIYGEDIILPKIYKETPDPFLNINKLKMDEIFNKNTIDLVKLKSEL